MEGLSFIVVGPGEFESMMENEVTKQSLMDLLHEGFPDCSPATYEAFVSSEEFKEYDKYSFVVDGDKIVSMAICGEQLDHFTFKEKEDSYLIRYVTTLKTYSNKGLCKKVVFNLVNSYWDNQKQLFNLVRSRITKNTSNKMPLRQNVENMKKFNEFAFRLFVKQATEFAIRCYSKVGFVKEREYKHRVTQEPHQFMTLSAHGFMNSEMFNTTNPSNSSARKSRKFKKSRKSRKASRKNRK